MTSRQEIIQGNFRLFQQEIDEYNDRRERLIKSSRDVTTASKRLIFNLHRFPHQALSTLTDADHKESEDESSKSKVAMKVLSDAQTKKNEIVQIIMRTAKQEGFDREFNNGEDDSSVEIGRATRYEKAFGSGLEEFIEAISFMHFLQYASLITLSEVQALFLEEGKSIIPIPASRYLLGLSDLTGELMRFATNAVGLGHAGEVVILVLNLIRDIRSNLDPFVPFIKDMKKKQTVTTQSMRKIEDVSYAIKVRSSEFASNPEALQEMLKRSIASDGRPEEDEA